jgi:acyl-CoA thioester hydrolase
MSSWRWITHEHVRFGDCDPMGHANNAVYSTYLEQARITALGGLDPFILARVEIDFRLELHAGDEIEIRTRCSHVGTKSFELEHEIWSGDRLAANARSVLVGYDYETHTSVPLPDETRRRLSE